MGESPSQVRQPLLPGTGALGGPSVLRTLEGSSPFHLVCAGSQSPRGWFCSGAAVCVWIPAYSPGVGSVAHNFLRLSPGLSHSAHRDADLGHSPDAAVLKFVMFVKTASSEVRLLQAVKEFSVPGDLGEVESRESPVRCVR